MDVHASHWYLIDRAVTHPLQLPPSVIDEMIVEEKVVLEVCGYLFWALSSKRIVPLTDDEKNFVRVVCQQLETASTEDEKVWIKWHPHLLFVSDDFSPKFCQQKVVKIQGPSRFMERASLWSDPDLTPGDPG